MQARFADAERLGRETVELGLGPVKLTYHLAHAIVSVASGPKQVARDCLARRQPTGSGTSPRTSCG